ncbi:hypothetical protein CkaCkLH20_07834 [Colletotrichum karsti]|uniref:Uncharacterized protein n=1 Tax=Colletotrichum karsti TaxID=1095194 RepID=A0A9P6LJM0_9PEZI|nr:uncharacterized protein CkaCkLH20_07834 [Colletotrichum karsti]KAF9874697.1 hypothetical protein CkaCkLH20_07834 [Colletotrichum karsti]
MEIRLFPLRISRIGIILHDSLLHLQLNLIVRSHDSHIQDAFSREFEQTAERLAAARVGTLYPTYRSKFGPKYNTVPNVAGWTVSQVVKLGLRAGGFGAAAGVAALFYTSGIPRIQKDILQASSPELAR